MVDPRVHVILSKGRRVRHAVVLAYGAPVPICGNWGDFPYIEPATASPHIPLCENCKIESSRIASVFSPKEG